MKNFLLIDRPAGRVNALISTIAIAVLLMAMCQPAQGQVRITGAFGLIDKPLLVGQLNVGYDANAFFAGADMIRQASNKGTWFGIKAGYSVNVYEETKIKVYSGIQYKAVGSNHSYDRHIENGQTHYLSTGLETNAVHIPVGLQLNKGPLFIDAGAMVGKETVFMLTIGITHLFSRN